MAGIIPSFNIQNIRKVNSYRSEYLKLEIWTEREIIHLMKTWQESKEGLMASNPRKKVAIHKTCTQST